MGKSECCVICVSAQTC